MNWHLLQIIFSKQISAAISVVILQFSVIVFALSCVSFQYAPVVMVIVSISGAAAQFGCYFADGALQLKLMTNSTTLPIQVEQFINVLRMTSLIHILYAFWFFLLFNLVSLYTLMSSMREFNGKSLYSTPSLFTSFYAPQKGRGFSPSFHYAIMIIKIIVRRIVKPVFTSQY